MGNEAHQVAISDQLSAWMRDLARAELVYFEELRYKMGKRQAKRMTEKLHREFVEGTFNKAAGIGDLLKGRE